MEYNKYHVCMGCDTELNCSGKKCINRGGYMVNRHYHMYYEESILCDESILCSDCHSKEVGLK